MPPRRFTRQLLDEILQQEGATLTGDYEMFKDDVVIRYICKCGTCHQKSFRSIVRSGAVCKKCGNALQLKKSRKTWYENYGVENPAQSDIVKDKAKKTNLERYGTEHTFQSDTVKEKTKKTNLDRYGVENPNQIEAVKEKSRKTNLERYGAENPNQNATVKEKAKKTCLERYGVTSTSLVPEIKAMQKATMLLKHGVEHNFQAGPLRDKRAETFLDKYGVEHPAQNQEVMERTQKNAKKYKEYTMPSGTIRKVQGYEPFALRDLLETYSEDQIKTDRKDVPHVQYTVEGKKRVHFPDIFIPHENKLIEVKSTWTLKCKRDNIQLKKKACEDQGFRYEIWCFDAKGKRVED